MGRISIPARMLVAILVAMLLLCVLPAAALAAAGPYDFTDVDPSDSWFEAIQGMADYGVATGYDDGTFRPNNPLWRAQFAKMIVNTLGLWVDEEDYPPLPFTDLGPDVPGNLYPHEYVAAAYKREIIKGKTATTFAPYSNVTRAQAVTMVVRALQSLHPQTLLAPPPGYHNTWGTAFSSEHGPLARIAEYNHLLDGLDLDGAAANPWSSMPRGEIAQVLWNVMDLIIVTATGRVTDEYGAEIGNVQVTLLTYSGEGNNSSITAASGYYTVVARIRDFTQGGRQVNDDVSYWVRTTNTGGYVDVYYPDYPVVTSRATDAYLFYDVGATGTIHADFSLETGHTLSGYVRDTLSAPIPGAEVRASASARVGPVTTTSGPDGSYSFTGLPTAEYNLSVEIGSSYFAYPGNPLSLTTNQSNVNFSIAP